MEKAAGTPYGSPVPDRPQQIRGHQHQADAQDHHDEND
jgi:hypothetical protein